MFHKALSIPLQLGSITKHNACRRACIHGHTPPGWRAQASTQHLIYYHSGLSGAQPHHTAFFHFCYILRSVGMNGLLKTYNSHRCLRTVDWHSQTAFSILKCNISMWLLEYVFFYVFYSRLWSQDSLHCTNVVLLTKK